MNPNHFTETLLPLFTALQPFFRERMGKLQYGDEFIVDVGYGIGMETFFYNNNWEDQDLSDAICLPRTIDDSSEEAQKRSLWGMVDWSRFNFENLSDGSGNVLMFEFKSQGDFSFTGTPTEAILKALVAQEGVGAGG